MAVVAKNMGSVPCGGAKLHQERGGPSVCSEGLQSTIWVGWQHKPHHESNLAEYWQKKKVKKYHRGKQAPPPPSFEPERWRYPCHDRENAEIRK